jgi:hypothetical protein
MRALRLHVRLRAKRAVTATSVSGVVEGSPLMSRIKRTMAENGLTALMVAPGPAAWHHRGEFSTVSVSRRRYSVLHRGSTSAVFVTQGV